MTAGRARRRFARRPRRRFTRLVSPVTLALATALLVACGTGSQPPGHAPSADRSSAPAATASPSSPETDSDPSSPAAAESSAPPSGDPPVAQSGSQLPRGGRQVFPAYRLVGYAGYPGSVPLGRLGIGDLNDRVAELEPLAASYAAGRQPLPVLELIATVVRAAPGADGMYRTRASDALIERHLAAARAARGYLLLNIQPGRAAFLDEVRAYERWLREPDVGVALDPEWAIGPGQIPGRVYGRVTGAQLDAVAAYLSGLVAANSLPEKVMLYHQLAPQIVVNPAALRAYPGIALVVSVDGIGPMAQKVATWSRIMALTPPHVRRGFKVFYQEDAAQGPLMTPAQVLSLVPQPEYVLYE